ncbi:MAG: T9SS type A sorting domain-containing protein [Candidatus Aegiribacteria sp.]|nr:T9SS type A sorting domain-containing protein [Candidatus Aegiribacteria sp.]
METSRLCSSVIALIAMNCLALSEVYADEVLVRLTGLRDCSVESLHADGYDVTSVNLNQDYVDIFIDRADISTLEEKAQNIKILPESWGSLLPSNAANAGYYYSPDENWDFWTDLAATYPDLVQSPVTIGQSFQGRDIYSICITSSSGPSDKPAIHFNALTHAREPAGNSVMIDFGMWLATEYDNDTMATFILDNSEIYLVPIVNPDGYVANMPGGGNQRKNMNFTTPVTSDGIDLNRNFGYQWGYDNMGSSPNPYDPTYRGSAAFSEPETETLRSFINSIDPIGSIHYHSYGGMLIYPWNYVNQPTPHQSTFQSWASAMTAQNGYQYGRCGELMYPANGDACDWSYENSEHQTCLSFGVEVDDNGFWGSQNDSTAIADFSTECRFMNKMLCMNLLNQTGIEYESETGYSGMLSVEGVSPNPVTNAMNLSVRIPSGSLAVTVYDLSGRRVDEFSLENPDSGDCQLKWVVPEGTPNGVYTLIIQSGSQTAGSRFTVLR